MEADRHTFSELIERYIAEVIPTKKDWAKQQVTHLRAWLAIIGNVKLSRVTSDAIDRRRQSLLRRVATLHGQGVRLGLDRA